MTERLENAAAQMLTAFEEAYLKGWMEDWMVKPYWALRAAWNTRANAESCKPTGLTEVKERSNYTSKDPRDEQIRILRVGLEDVKKVPLKGNALVVLAEVQDRANNALAAADKLGVR